jgi:phage/conjugal plasmid C-4 type zinc finger TraR family protein
VADEADLAHDVEETLRTDALRYHAIRARPIEAPSLVRGRRVCKSCGDAIPAGRLAAVPTAVRCVECEQDLKG